MNERTREKLRTWVALANPNPESQHPLDNERLFDFVYEACQHDDEVDKTALDNALRETHPDWDDNTINDFISRYLVKIERLKDFGLFCLQRMNTQQ